MLLSLKDAFFGLVAIGFAVSGVSAFATGFWLLIAVSGDTRSMRQCAIAALEGEWPELPAAIWYRRSWLAVFGFWSTGLVVGVLYSIVKAVL